MICELISNLYGIKCLSNLLQLEQCNVVFKVISDIMAHWYEMRNTIILAISFWKENDLCIDVISDIMSNWYEMLNTIIVAICFCTGKKMICALMFILNNH